MATACTTGTDSEEKNGDNASATIRLLPCPEWDSRSAADIKQLVDASLSRLAGLGMALDGAFLDDEARMSTLLEEVYRSAGCQLTTPDGAALALTADGVNYCGAGQGSPQRYRPTVTPCVNEACRTHDACYVMCSSPISKSCHFSNASVSCDAQFLSALDACTDTAEYWFASQVVSIVAHTLGALDRTSCTAVTCPAYGALGNGPCGIASDSPGCIACLNAVDPSGSCRKTSCAVDPTDDLLYAATCPNVGQCYGGYGFGDPRIVDPSNGDVTSAIPAATAKWKLVLLSGTMPSTNATDDPWDLEQGLDLGAPDPYVALSVNSVEQIRTGTVQNSPAPQWGIQLASDMTTSQLLGAVELQVWDADSIFDQLIGSCVLAADLSAFSGEPVALKCDTSDLSLTVRLDQ